VRFENLCEKKDISQVSQYSSFSRMDFRVPNYSDFGVELKVEIILGKEDEFKR
jgi:hypothetical protein